MKKILLFTILFFSSSFSQAQDLKGYSICVIHKYDDGWIYYGTYFIDSSKLDYFFNHIGGNYLTDTFMRVFDYSGITFSTLNLDLPNHYTTYEQIDLNEQKTLSYDLDDRKNFYFNKTDRNSYLFYIRKITINVGKLTCPDIIPSDISFLAWGKKNNFILTRIIKKQDFDSEDSTEKLGLLPAYEKDVKSFLKR